MIDLAAASLFPMLPISQAPDLTVAVKPSITVISENEFLILSWTGASTIGVFITGDGDPVRGTLEWPSHPEAVCKSSYCRTTVPGLTVRSLLLTALDYPYVTTLLPNGTIEIHSIETQSIVQVVSAPADSPSPLADDRKALISCLNGFFVPSTQRSEKMRMVPRRLLRRPARVHDNARIASSVEDIVHLPAL